MPALRLFPWGAFPLALAAAGLAAKPFLFPAKLAAAPLVGLGLAGRDRVDARARRLDRQRDDVDRGAGEAARQEQRKGEEKDAHQLSIDIGN